MMRTANTSKSDPDLAGLMLRCDEKLGFDVSLALVRPIPPRTKREVVIGWGTTQSSFRAEASSEGTTLNLPIEATALAKDAWHNVTELALTVRDPEGEVHGAIPIDGLAAAVTRLSANCPK